MSDLLKRIADTLFGERLELRVRLFNIWALVGVFVGLVSAGYCLLDGEGPLTASFCVAISAFLLGLILYAIKTGRYIMCYAATIIVVFVISYGAVFFIGGGSFSSMPFYFIIAIAFTMYMLEGRWAITLAIAEVVFYSGLCVYAFVRPVSVNGFASELTRLIDIVAGFVVVSAMLSVTIRFQVRMFERQRQDLESARDEAQRYSEAKGRFLANMSHEIRTPINVIMGMNEMVLRESGQASVRGYAKNIEKAGKTLMTLISNVLDVSRVESGKIEIVNESYSTYELADELSMTGEELAGQRGLEFRFVIDESLPRTLIGDRAHVKQVALNFLGNAVKYTKKGHVGLEIYYAAGDLCVAVSDTGIGIKPEAVSGLFDAFSRSDESYGSSVDGVGLGLAIAKELTELMNGRIDVKSEPGAGSVFIASFPQTVADEAVDGRLSFLASAKNVARGSMAAGAALAAGAAGTTVTAGPAGTAGTAVAAGSARATRGLPGARRDEHDRHDLGGAYGFRGEATKAADTAANRIGAPHTSYAPYAALGLADGRTSARRLSRGVADSPYDSVARRERTRMVAPNAKTLIVDDNEENRDVLLALLERTRTRVDAVASGAECIAAARKTRYDVIFLDYMMPGMDGVETLTALKAIPGFNTPVIALTANVVAGVEHRLLEAGFSKYLSKPVMWADLENALLSSLPLSLLERGTDTRVRGKIVADREKLAASGIILDEALAYFGGDVRQYLRVAEIFCEGANAGIKETGLWVDSRDWENLRHKAHSLKSSAKSVGASNLSATAARLETLCENKEEEEYIASIAPLLKYEWTKARDALFEFCAKNSESEAAERSNGTGDASFSETASALEGLLKEGRQSDAVELIDKLVKICASGKSGVTVGKTEITAYLGQARSLVLDAEYRDAASVLRKVGIITS